MSQAWIALGSNLGDPPAQLRHAIDAVRALDGVSVTAVSSFYRTDPVGPPGQPDFCNAVAGIETRLAPEALLARLQAIERTAGRERSERWGPRTLDLDLLFYDDAVIDAPDLQVPHPRLAERAFVLVPLAEVAPGADVPGHGRVADLRAAVDEAGVRLWSGDERC